MVLAYNGILSINMQTTGIWRFCCASTVIALLLVGSSATEEPEKGYSPVLSRYLYMVNGNYTARVQTTDMFGNAVVSYDHFFVIPVNTPPSRDDVEILFLGFSNDTVINQHFLYTLADGPIDGTLRLEIYKLSMYDILRSHESANGVLTLPSDAKIEHMGRCPAWFKETEVGLFNAYWKDCLLEIEGENPTAYIDNITCDGVHTFLIEGNSTVVRHFVRHGGRYPLMPEIEERMKGTENPCKGE